MIIEVNDGIKEYWNEVKDQYPNLNYEEFQEICKNPFNFFKSKIETDEMPNIDIKYLGKFRVYEGRIKSLLKELETRHKFNRISLERYEEHKANLLVILKKIQENDILRRDQKSNKKRSSTN